MHCRKPPVLDSFLKSGAVTNSILNICAYRFVTIDDPAALRNQLHDQASRLGLLGTILLAHEGINLFLAGPAETVHAFLAQLRGGGQALAGPGP
jgi:UPF0176 protein